MISNGLCNITGTAAEYRARACETLKSKWQWRIIFSFLKRFIYFKGKKWNKIIIAKLYYQTILLLNLSTGYLTCTLKLSLTTTCFEEIRTNGVLVLLSDLNSIWFLKKPIKSFMIRTLLRISWINMIINLEIWNKVSWPW